MIKLSACQRVWIHRVPPTRAVADGSCAPRLTPTIDTPTLPDCGCSTNKKRGDCVRQQCQCIWHLCLHRRRPGREADAKESGEDGTEFDTRAIKRGASNVKLSDKVPLLSIPVCISYVKRLSSERLHNNISQIANSFKIRRVCKNGSARRSRHAPRTSRRNRAAQDTGVERKELTWSERRPSKGVRTHGDGERGLGRGRRQCKFAAKPAVRYPVRSKRPSPSYARTR
jgi:hypothetical protein